MVVAESPLVRWRGDLPPDPNDTLVSALAELAGSLRAAGWNVEGAPDNTWYGLVFAGRQRARRPRATEVAAAPPLERELRESQPSRSCDRSWGLRVTRPSASGSCGSRRNGSRSSAPSAFPLCRLRPPGGGPSGSSSSPRASSWPRRSSSRVRVALRRGGRCADDGRGLPRLRQLPRHATAAHRV